MGFLLSFISCSLAASKDLVSKRLASQLDGTVSTFASFAFALPFYAVTLAVLFCLGKETFDLTLPFLVLVLLRSVTDTFAETMKMYALAHADLSLVTCFFSLSPLFLLVTSPLITGDEVSALGIVAVVLVVAGSLLMVYRPPPGDWAAQKKGILLAIGASVFFSLNSCYDRLAVQQGTPVFAGFAMTLLSALFLLPLVVRRPDRLQALTAYRGNFTLRGLLETGFMVSKLYAMQYLEAPYVVAIQRLSVIPSIVGGRVLFKEGDFARRLAAGTLMLAGVLLIILERIILKGWSAP